VVLLLGPYLSAVEIDADIAKAYCDSGPCWVRNEVDGEEYAKEVAARRIVCLNEPKRF